ncbi:nuclear pore complex protein Nup107-like [Lingula anatina]|uniref:Nuclear pore complex protein n=1 Tax=Lingula anatina TaxID=7574 RepID=A0A1S3I2Z3_LINAN|nr:nuclear pore complex protein Nup107-like [Lingula anatina]|eukprot:XP_013392603.1 nuclear pore complex protein Nup107-like [Lingula anatina]
MASGTRKSGRFSSEAPDNTIADIWVYSQRQAAGQFDPEEMNRNIDRRRQLRNEGSNRQSFGTLLTENQSPKTRSQQRSANVNVQRSLQLLDEAVGTPGPLLRSARKTPLKHSSYTPKPIPTSAKFDVSATLGATPGQSMMMETPMSLSQVSRVGESFNDSLGFTPLRTGAQEPHGMDEDITTTNVALLLEEDPGLAASTGLFGDFLQAVKDHPAEPQVFDLIKSYTQVCSEQVVLLKKLINRATPGHSRFTKTIDVLNILEQEKNTWALVGSLFRDRLETEVKGDQEDMIVDQLGKKMSEKEIVDRLYETDHSLRQGQLVIDWLEQVAAGELENYYDKVEFFSDQSVTWENTLHSLQQRAGAVPAGYNRPIVDKMDPDAPVRQKRPLADLDQEDEGRLLKYIFVYIRAGQLDEAQRLCSKCGQAWRAATLEGWRLYHDPNYHSLGPGGEVSAVEGNPYRDVWKAVCWRMAQEDRFNLYEKATYAALSGNLKELLPACETWEDCLWAYFKCMVDARVEQEIRVATMTDRPLEQLPGAFWDKMLTPQAIFQEIQASDNDEVRLEANEKYHIIQKYVILDDVPGLIEEMYSWLSNSGIKPPHHLIRFMAHLVLFLRTIGKTTKEEMCTFILESYVMSLIEEKHTTLVAHYVSTLPQDLQLEWYARFLQGIEDREARQQCLALAEEAGLDIPNITKLVVEKIRTKGPDFKIDRDAALEAATTEEDHQKIEAIDWLVFDPSQRAEAVRQANAVMRTFIALKKHAAAREVFSKIPPGSIDIIYRNCQMQHGTTELPAEDDNAIREYLCHKAYLDAHDSFNDWFEHYHNAKPSKPDVPQKASFTERVAFEHREKQYEADMDRWRRSLELQTKTTVERIYNVLLFVDGGWMADQRQVGMEGKD